MKLVLPVLYPKFPRDARRGFGLEIHRRVCYSICKCHGSERGNRYGISSGGVR